MLVGVSTVDGMKRLVAGADAALAAAGSQPAKRAPQPSPDPVRLVRRTEGEADEDGTYPGEVIEWNETLQGFKVIGPCRLRDVSGVAPARFSGMSADGKYGVYVNGGASGGAGSQFYRVTGAPDPVDDPPPGTEGGEWVPPRFSYHVYTVEPVYYDWDEGAFKPDPSRTGGTSVRVPSSQFPPPKMVVGQVTTGVPSAQFPGKIEIAAWGSQRAISQQFATHFKLACVDTGGGVFVPQVVTYSRSITIMGRDLCITQPAVETIEEE